MVNRHLKWIITGCPIVLGLTLSLAMVLHTDAAKPTLSNDPTIIVLTASWCGTCREITPMVQHIIETSPQMNLALMTLDVDAPEAHDKANSLGITEIGSAVPEIYLRNNGQTTLLFNGSHYHYGHISQAESLIRQQLQTDLKK